MSLTSAQRRRRHAMTGALCLAVAVGAAAAWAVQRGDASPSAPVVSEFGARPSTIESTPPSPQDDIGSASRANVNRSSAASAPPSTTFGEVPAVLVIPAIGVTAEVDRVGVQADGQVQIPEDGTRIGWYRYGTAPGSEQGSTVLVGHRDTEEQGPGAMYRLGELKPGDQIQVLREDWTTLTYSVVARDALAKSAFPGDELFRRTGTPVLTLITCGGDYVPGSGYTENVVVTAVPVNPAA